MTDLLFVWLPMIAAGAGLVFGALLIAMGFRNYVKAEMLQRKGVRTQATISRLYKEKIHVSSQDRRPGNPTRYTRYLDYRFEHAGQTFERRKTLPASDVWDRAAEGDSIEVLYLKDDPASNDLAAKPTAVGLAGGFIQMAFGGCLTAATLAYFANGIAAAMIGPALLEPANDWVPDEAFINAIYQSDDPFVRLLKPDHRIVRVKIGREGRVFPGQREILMAPDGWRDLNVDDVVPALRDPENRNRAILQNERSR